MWNNDEESEENEDHDLKDPKGHDDRIKRFRLEWMPWASAIVILGMRKRGKTFFMRQLTDHFNADWNFVFAGSEGTYRAFIDLNNPLFIFDAYSDVSIVEEKLDELMVMLANKALPRPRKILVVIDDLGMEKGLMKSQIILDFFSRGRNFNEIGEELMGLTVILSLQYAKMIEPPIRSNIDFLFCFELSSSECYDTVRKCYTTLKPKQFDAIMDRLHKTRERAQMVINNEPGARRRGENVCYFQASAVTRAEPVGCPEINDLATRFVDKNRWRAVPRKARESKTKAKPSARGRGRAKAKEPTFYKFESDSS
jgi:hypothetical protein